LKSHQPKVDGFFAFKQASNNNLRDILFDKLSQFLLKTLILLSFQFYRILLLFNIACSLLGIALVWYGFGRIDGGILFIAKILGFAGAVMLHRYNAKETYYYFRNAGYRMRRLIGAAFIVDILVYFSIFLLINLANHAAEYFKG